MASQDEREAPAVREVQEPILGEKEEWRPIVGYEGRYEVSNLGRVRRTPVIVGYQLSADGYCYVGLPLDTENDYGGLRRDGAQTVRVHRLVARAFIGPCPEGKEVNHIDGVPSHNAVSNLEYVTRSENLRHAYRLGLKPKLWGERAGRSSILDVTRRQIVAEWDSGTRNKAAIARKFSCSVDAVRCSIERAERWRA